jgi:hypothetical protein
MIRMSPIPPEGNSPIPYYMAKREWPPIRIKIKMIGRIVPSDTIALLQQPNIRCRTRIA